MNENFRVRLAAHSWWLHIPVSTGFLIAVALMPQSWIWLVLLYLVGAGGLAHYLETNRFAIARQRIELDHMVMYNRAQEEFEQEWFDAEMFDGEDDDDDEGIVGEEDDT